MHSRLETDGPLIEPIYSQTGPSQPIDLGAVETEWSHAGKPYRGSAVVAVTFTPDVRLSFLIPSQGEHPLLALALLVDTNWDGKLTLLDRNITLPVWAAGAAGQNRILFVPKMSVVTVTPRTNDTATAVFHLFNFPGFLGPDDYLITHREGTRLDSRRCGRAILRADGWNITIAAFEKTEDLFKALSGQGGYVITHMGRIEREDGSNFSSAELDNILHCLHYFLSFALGRWAGVALPIGYDKAGRKVFEQWGLPLTASGPWHGISWFDAHHGEFLSEVFPGFMALWKHNLWNRPLMTVLYWYLGAGERGTGIGVDTGLILAQAALELLAWTYCVHHRKMVSEDAFKSRGLSAANKLRMLASSLDIPLEIPSCLSALHAKRGEKWRDSMHAITDIRNAIVHPKTTQQLPDGSYCEGWKLSLWYIDMALLRLCGHTGKYSNRLVERWTRQVEPVPWARSESDGAGP